MIDQRPWMTDRRDADETALALATVILWALIVTLGVAVLA